MSRLECYLHRQREVWDPRSRGAPCGGSENRGRCSAMNRRPTAPTKMVATLIADEWSGWAGCSKGERALEDTTQRLTVPPSPTGTGGPVRTPNEGPLRRPEPGTARGRQETFHRGGHDLGLVGLQRSVSGGAVSWRNATCRSGDQWPPG
ncbi:hypothetical protein NDU88_007929 [Pleurodeles waltl]|uniref:Uncharacterized protein n=1 Tax=Pleurodeles waltl TaxID=8319 RepID=A0AAV7QM71_PLEWA|nr:hypothetical protein NDU88_007929 [Pleurodeles waltl]